MYNLKDGFRFGYFKYLANVDGWALNSIERHDFGSFYTGWTEVIDFEVSSQRILFIFIFEESLSGLGEVEYFEVLQFMDE